METPKLERENNKHQHQITTFFCNPDRSLIDRSECQVCGRVCLVRHECPRDYLGMHFADHPVLSCMHPGVRPTRLISLCVHALAIVVPCSRSCMCVYIYILVRRSHIRTLPIFFNIHGSIIASVWTSIMFSYDPNSFTHI